MDISTIRGFVLCESGFFSEFELLPAESRSSFGALVDIGVWILGAFWKCCVYEVSVL